MKSHIAFIHPDLGLGGAEQLIVNLCLAARQHNYQPHIYTPTHHQSFPETHDGRITIHEHGSFFGLIPDTIFGRFKGILAYIRSLICTLWLLFYGIHDYSVVVADQVSIVLPLLRLCGHKTIFYCHYPDKLLAGERGFLKKIYRFAIDFVEEVSILFAHKVYVNSLYTKGVFYRSFSILKLLGVKVEVLYPAIDFSQFDSQIKENEQTTRVKREINGKFVCSLNRYEKKKDIKLALQAFSDLLLAHPELELKLVIAGGYDPKVSENKECLDALKQLAATLSIDKSTLFYTSVNNDTRKFILSNAQCVLYTPTNEHFGIVPVEAMYLGVPVIANNNGGPKESVGDGCGYLCEGKHQWTTAMWEILTKAKPMDKGRQQVISKFGFEHFSSQFATEIARLI